MNSFILGNNRLQILFFSALGYALDWLVPPLAGFDITVSIVTFPVDFVKKKIKMI